MNQIELYECYIKCPKCGSLKNYVYTEEIQIKDKNKYFFLYSCINYICKNENCENRWKIDG